MQLAGGMQPEAPPIVEIHDNGITSEHRSSSQTSWNINIVRPSVRCCSLSLQGATRARKVARAMKDAERKKDVAQHFKGGYLNAGFCEDERQPFHLNCYYWLILGERGTIALQNKAYHLYGEKRTSSGSQPNSQWSMWVRRMDMAFFPEEVFQVYDPIACKTFFDQTGNEKAPAQIVVAASRRNNDFETDNDVHPQIELVAGDPEFQGCQAKKLPFTRGEDSGPAAEFKAREVQEAHELRVATEQTEHAHAPEPEPFCPTRCMSPDNDNVTYDPHLLDTVLTKHGLQAALNVLQESDRAWFVNRLFEEGQPLYSQHEEEDAWMRRLSHLCTELRLQMPQLRKMGLDIRLMRAMLESDGM